MVVKKKVLESDSLQKYINLTDNLIRRKIRNKFEPSGNRTFVIIEKCFDFFFPFFNITSIFKIQIGHISITV